MSLVTKSFQICDSRKAGGGLTCKRGVSQGALTFRATRRWPGYHTGLMMSSVAIRTLDVYVKKLD